MVLFRGFLNSPCKSENAIAMERDISYVLESLQVLEMCEEVTVSVKTFHSYLLTPFDLFVSIPFFKLKTPSEVTS